MHPTLRRFWIRLTADRKRFGLLCGALAVGMLLWARLIVLTNIPRTAVAEKREHASARAPLERPARPENLGNGARGPEAHDPIILRLAHLPRRDPFVISNEHFPRPTNELFTPGEQGKLPASMVEDHAEAEARFTAALHQLVRRMRLDAVMHSPGATPLAVIDGRTVRAGEVVQVTVATPADFHGLASVDFRLVEVAPGGRRAVVLEYDGRRFELSMAQPGVK
jgi:hypothetical protein